MNIGACQTRKLAKYIYDKYIHPYEIRFYAVNSVVSSYRPLV